MKVFLDANILFSGAQSDTRMRAFLSVLFRHAECLTNAYAGEEARRNLELKLPAALPGLVELLQRCKLVPVVAVDLLNLQSGSQSVSESASNRKYHGQS